MTILVFGKTGQVGRALSAFSDVENVGRDDADLCDPASCAALIRAKKPQAVINAAAYTNVDAAEDDSKDAMIINALAPEAMALACVDLNIPLVHISTDYVYDGTGTDAKKTTDPTGPLNVYGRTKLAGEEAIRRANPTHAILRTSWVFSETGTNFVKSMLRLAQERDKLTIVSDQVGGPTSAQDLAQASYDIAKHLITNPADAGIYNFAGTPNVSWADFAREIFKQSGIGCTVESIPSSAFPTRASRPKNSRMNCDDLSILSVTRPDWRVSLTKVLKKIGSYDDKA